jgi:iron complex transport system substrate-binding protein
MAEICISLGLAERIVAAAEHSDYPALTNVTKINGWMVNYEEIIALRPDLILTTGSGNTAQTIRRLRALGLNVFHTEQPNLESILTTIRQIGILNFKEKEAETIISAMRQELNNYQETLAPYIAEKRKRVLYLLWTKPLMAPGGKTFLAEIISLAGGEPLFSEEKTRLIKPSLEQVILENPDVIFLPSGVRREDLDSRWRMTDALKAGQVFHIDENLVLRPGVNIVKGIKELGKKIYGIWEDGGGLK